MRVTANGEPLHLPEGAGLTHLFAAMNVSEKWVVAEVNGRPIDRAEMGATLLADGDRVEVVRAVAGG